VGCEAATWRLMGQESEHATPEQAEDGRAARQTPPLAIPMVSEGAEGLFLNPIQACHCFLHEGPGEVPIT